MMMEKKHKLLLQQSSPRFPKEGFFFFYLDFLWELDFWRIWICGGKCSSWISAGIIFIYNSTNMIFSFHPTKLDIDGSVHIYET